LKDVELAVIGAGLAAARGASSRGVAVTIVDDNPMPGGQYFRQAASDSLRRIAGAIFDESVRGASLLGTVDHARVDYRPDSTALGFFESELSVVSGGRATMLNPRCTVIAAGCTERPAPFPGWTLPGVIGAGSAQNLMKSQRIVPGKRILVGGNGPLNLLAASNLVRLGATVVAVVEAARDRQAWARIPGLLLEPAILMRGLGYRARMMMAGVPFHSAHVIVEARGSDRVEEARIAPISANGKVDLARSRTLGVDTIVWGFGLVPATEMTRALGCQHVYHARKGGWMPARSPLMETTRHNVFSVGDCAGVAGVEKALLEGRLAGLVAAQRLGLARDSGARRLNARLRARLARLERFRRAIEAVYAPGLDTLSLVTEDTIVCRCEDVVAAELRAALNEGVTEVNSLKAISRVSMGRCQGRNCLMTVAALIAEAQGCRLDEVVLPRPRSPMRPVNIGNLVAELEI
jgi:NADPH-dependent 2,4-dienoyl-CoA reductase/sulfur reductase-like enzyme